MWGKRIKNYQASGWSAARWCKENGVPESSFSTWKKKVLTLEEKKEPAVTQWVTVSKENRETTTAVTIRIGAVEMEVKPGYDAKHLQQVLRTVMALC
jgi:hypothetical protein